jgi:hypothetical protein
MQGVTKEDLAKAEEALQAANTGDNAAVSNAADADALSSSQLDDKSQDTLSQRTDTAQVGPISVRRVLVFFNFQSICLFLNIEQQLCVLTYFYHAVVIV